MALALAALAGCQSTDPTEASGPGVTPELVDERNADQFLVVDCLLPGKVRRLGSRMTYLTPRQAIKSSARDCEIRGGEYTAFDRASYADALRVWLPMAEAGDAEAQTYVGEIFERGVGGVPDPAAAAVWYLRAAEQNYGPAQLNLGSLYDRGAGVPKDPKKARDWYRRSAGLENLDERFVAFVSDAKAYEKMRSELERSGAETKALRKRIKELELRKATVREQHATRAVGLESDSQSLAEERRRFEKTAGELEAERRRLEQERSALAARRAAAAGEKARVAELERLEQELDKRELQLGARSRSLETLEAETTRRDKELEARRRELAQLDAELQRLAREAESRRQEYAGRVEKVAEPAPGPTLQLVDPELPVTRSSRQLTVYSSVKEQRILGRVVAPAGLLTLLVNDVEEKVNDEGFFESKVRVRTVGGTPIEIVAVDQQGKRANRQFVLMRGSGATVSPGPLPVAMERRTVGVDFGRYHALVIGNSRYEHLDHLPSAVEDARAVSTLLRQKYGFKVTSLYDANRYAILSALNDLRKGLGEGDNLIVYYAGHGELDEVNKRGYWLPVDADRDNPTNWISNVAITDIVNAIQAKHVMVVADSCYSGALTESGIASADEELSGDARTTWQKALVGRRARTALSSGGIAPVLDDGGGGHSVFARAFLDVLNRNDDVLEGSRLYREVAAQVESQARTRGFRQEPTYAPIRFGRHEAGDFFFVPTG